MQQVITMLAHYSARYYNVGALLGQILQCWSIPGPDITMLEHSWARYYNVGAFLGQILQCWSIPGPDITMLEHSLARYYNVGALMSQILQCWSITGPDIRTRTINKMFILFIWNCATAEFIWNCATAERSSPPTVTSHVEYFLGTLDSVTGNSEFCQRAPRTIYLRAAATNRFLQDSLLDRTSHSHTQYRNEARLISRVEQNCRLQWRLHDIVLTAILSQDAVQYFKVPHTHHPLYPGVKRVLYCCPSQSPHYSPSVYLFRFAVESKSGLLYVRASPSFRFREGRDCIIFIWGWK